MRTLSCQSRASSPVKLSAMSNVRGPCCVQLAKHVVVDVAVASSLSLSLFGAQFWKVNLKELAIFETKHCSISHAATLKAKSAHT